MSTDRPWGSGQAITRFVAAAVAYPLALWLLPSPRGRGDGLFIAAVGWIPLLQVALGSAWVFGALSAKGWRGASWEARLGVPFALLLLDFLTLLAIIGHYGAGH